MQNQLTIYNYAPAQSMVLSEALVGLRGSIRQAAQNNLDMVLAEDDGFTMTERQSMLMVEELRMVNGVDLAAVLMRADLLHQIERTNALANHPARYGTMAAMAADQGISAAELSQTLDLADIVFPFVQEHLGIPISQLWEQVGKANLRELTPILKSIITGEESNTRSVRTSVEHILDDVAATAEAAGQEIDEAEVRTRAVEQLIEDGINLPNRQLRQTIRPDRTEPIVGSVVRDGGRRLVVLEVQDNGQWELLNRRLSGYFETQDFEMPVNPQVRQTEARRIPGLRELLRMLGA